MIEENEIVQIESQPTSNNETTALTNIDNASLQLEAERILNELIAETNLNKAKDLTYLFNLNQNKKTMVRMNKQSELLDLLTDTTIARVKDKPDNLSNDDLTKLMKIVADLIDKGQNQIIRSESAPLIQVNQQNNEISMENSTLSRDAKERVKNAVMSLLQGVTNVDTTSIKDIIDPLGDDADDD